MTISICMGSSCYARGNNRNLEVIQAFVREHGIDADVTIRGGLCHGKCRQGPNVSVNGIAYTSVDPNACLDILNRHCADIAAV